MRQTILIGALILGFGLPARADTGLTLRQAVDRALAANRTMDNARKAIEEAQATRSAVRKERLPKLRTNYSYTRSITDFSLSGEYPSEIDPSVMEKFSITFPRDNYMWTSWIHMPVLSRMQDLQEEIARLGVDVARVQLLQAQSDLVASVKAAYCGLVRDAKLIEFLTQNVRSYEEHLKLTEKFQVQGLVARNSVMEARVERANALQELETAKHAYEVSQAALATLLGLSDSDEALVAVDPLVPRRCDLTVKRCLDYARCHNPELVAFTYLRAQGGREVSLEKSQQRPTLDFSAYYMKYGDTPGLTIRDSEGFPNTTALAMFSVNWLVSDWGQTRAQAKAKKLKLDQIVNNETLARDRVSLRVREAWTQLRTAQQNHATALLAVEAATENVRLAHLRYREQTATSKEVLDALTGLKRAEFGRTTALHSQNVALARLEEAMGAEISHIVATTPPAGGPPVASPPPKARRR